jgi:histidine ammonia-lyase
MRAPLQPGPGTAAVRDRVRQDVAGPGVDRYLAPEIEAVVQLAAAGALVESAEQVVGELR